MTGRILPYSPADTATAADWLDYVADAIGDAQTGAEAVSAICEAIDKLERRGVITSTVAALLAEIFDVTEPAALAVA